MDAANRAEHERTPLLLEWPCCVFVPVATERALLPILLRALQERGMMSSHPAWRMREIEGACARLGVSLETALSLRRHHIQLRQRGVPGSLLALGSDAEIKAQASAFERAIATYLDARGVSYVDEAAHAAHNLETYGRSRPTPDFWLTTPITLRIFGSGEADSRPLHWIEAKHFYAADSVSSGDGKSAVGRVLQTVEKYVALYGPGAIVFAYGCGEALGAAIEARGAIVLDATPLDMRAVQALAARTQ